VLPADRDPLGDVGGRTPGRKDATERECGTGPMIAVSLALVRFPVEPRHGPE